MIALIHDRPDISIYLYSELENMNFEWITQYSKIKDIFYDKDQMSKQLLIDIKEYDQVQQQQFRNNNDDNDDDLKQIVPPITVFNSDLKENSIKNLSKESVVFIWFQMLIEILLRMKHTSETTNEMLDECRRYYFGNETVLKKINNFQQGYCSEQAVQWWTHDSFLYRLVNKAFRTEDIATVYPFRSYITDLHEQLLDLNMRRGNNIRRAYCGKK
ncbi:unnamed protein product, partial [Didymodactylos carnosus]